MIRSLEDIGDEDFIVSPDCKIIPRKIKRA